MPGIEDQTKTLVIVELDRKRRISVFEFAANAISTIRGQFKIERLFLCEYPH
jgi:hypothetical protein